MAVNQKLKECNVIKKRNTIYDQQIAEARGNPVRDASRRECVTEMPKEITCQL